MSNGRISRQEIESLCKTPNPYTRNFMFEQKDHSNVTIVKITNPHESIPFYTGTLGMTLLDQMHFSLMEFSVFLLGYENPADVPTGRMERCDWATNRKAFLELIYDWGTDHNTPIHNDTSPIPQRYGYISLFVRNIDDVCARFKKQGIKFMRKVNDTKTKDLVFIQDPDGIWLDIIANKTAE